MLLGKDVACDPMAGAIVVIWSSKVMGGVAAEFFEGDCIIVKK